MPEVVSRVFVIVNPQKDDARSILQEIQRYFRSRGVALSLHDQNGSIPDAALRDVDLAISLGGDGTLLSCARACVHGGIPILAVNLGTFGFITEVSKTEWRAAYEKFISGKLGISRRVMIEASVMRGKDVICSLTGLNDAVVGSSGISRLIELKLFLANSYVGRYRADGVIISTPTGSTAYSMGAGGPILHPEMEAFILNPICPFTLSNRPLVVSGHEDIELEVERLERTDVVLTVDGQQPVPLEPGDRIGLRMLENRSLIIRSDQRNFYEVLRSKLKWSGEPNA